MLFLKSAHKIYNDLKIRGILENVHATAQILGIQPDWPEVGVSLSPGNSQHQVRLAAGWEWHADLAQANLGMPGPFGPGILMLNHRLPSSSWRGV